MTPASQGAVKRGDARTSPSTCRCSELVAKAIKTPFPANGGGEVRTQWGHFLSFGLLAATQQQGELLGRILCGTQEETRSDPGFR